MLINVCQGQFSIWELVYSIFKILTCKNFILVRVIKHESKYNIYQTVVELWDRKYDKVRKSAEQGTLCYCQNDEMEFEKWPKGIRNVSCADIWARCIHHRGKNRKFQTYAWSKTEKGQTHVLNEVRMGLMDSQYSKSRSLLWGFKLSNWRIQRHGGI